MRAFFLAVGLLLSGSAFGKTGFDLLRQCQNDASTFDNAFCLGYLDGVTDGLSNKHLALRLAKVERDFWAVVLYGSEYCLREKVTLGQIRLIFIKYAKENPATLDQAAVGIVESALAQSFPCK